MSPFRALPRCLQAGIQTIAQHADALVSVAISSRRCGRLRHATIWWWQRAGAHARSWPPPCICASRRTRRCDARKARRALGRRSCRERRHQINRSLDRSIGILPVACAHRRGKLRPFRDRSCQAPRCLDHAISLLTAITRGSTCRAIAAGTRRDRADRFLNVQIGASSLASISRTVSSTALCSVRTVMMCLPLVRHKNGCA